VNSQLVWELLAIFVLILANGFFSLAEFSIIASRKSKLRQKLEQNKKGADKALKLWESHEHFLATIQVGITAVAALVGVFSGATIVVRLTELMAEVPIEMISSAAKPIAMTLVVISITILSVVVGELVPKYLALSFPERYARRIAGPVTVFVNMTAIFSKLLSNMAVFIVRIMGVNRDKGEHSVSEDEINQLLIEGHDLGVFDETEREFVTAVFDFADSTVRRAMTPRTDVIALPLGATPDETFKVIKEHGYSRYPIYEGDIDHVVGVIYTKDIITHGLDTSQIKIAEVMRKPFYVPDSMPLPRLLKEFQKGNSHLVVVLDEFGGTAGIITLEDVLEELVGEIQDEYDAEAEPLIQNSEKVAYADSSVWPGDVNEMLGCHLPEDDIDTLTGLVMEEVGRMPRKRETVEIADARLTVLATDKNRVLRFRIEKIGNGNSKES
jgi:putative hemolysin